MAETLSLYKRTNLSVKQMAKQWGVPARKFLQALAPISLSAYNRNLLATLVRTHAENDHSEKKEYKPISVAVSTKSIVTQIAEEYNVHPSYVVEALLDIALVPDNRAMLENALKWKETIEEQEETE